MHTFVLLAHSTYFRTYLDTQDPLKEVQVQDVQVAGAKRRKVTAFTALEPCIKCGPSSIIRCIDLPEEFGIPSTDEDYPTEEEFLLFLRHLYFASTLHLPPWVPKVELTTALTDDTPICLTFPSTPVFHTDIDAYTHMEGSGTQWSEELLSLFHYFDCQAALRRCGDIFVGLARLEGEDGLVHAWYLLPFVVRYGLKEAEAACLQRVGTDSDVRLTVPVYRELVATLAPATMAQVIEAMSIHIDNLNDKIAQL